MHKKAFVGIIIILALFIANIIYIGRKNLWFETRNKYWTELNSGDGLREGTQVTFNGLVIGVITDLTVSDENRIKVTFNVKKSLAKKITEGSLIKVTRSMMIGEKKLEVIPGPPGRPLIPHRGYIPGTDLREINELLSGEQFQRYLPQVERILNNVDILMASLARNPELGEKLVVILDDADVLLRAMSRSFLFKGSVKKLMEEDRLKKQRVNKK